MRKKRKIINLYDDDSVDSIKCVISISSEEDLNRFWDYLQNSGKCSYKKMSHFITDFYNFALSYIHTKESKFFEIILEESDKKLYFTLWNRKIVLLFQKHIEKKSFKYIAKQSRITIEFDKKKDITKASKKQKNTLNQTPLEPYTFLEAHDLEELLHLSENLQDIAFYIEKHTLVKEYFISLRSILSIFALTLRHYKEISSIANTITDLSNLINTNQEKFINLNSDETNLIIGYINNLDLWVQTLFVKGGAKLHFMDNSLRADYIMISQIINPIKDANVMNFDDIFNF